MYYAVLMDIDFFKINTNGNDLLLIDYLHKEPPPFSLFPVISRKLCKRHYGVGANGVIFLLPGKKSAVKLYYFLADGFQGSFCNDALICTARYAFDNGISGKDKLLVQTNPGIRTIEFIDSNNFRISLGIPKDTELNELKENPDGEYTTTLAIDEKHIPVTPLHLQAFGAVSYSFDSKKENLKYFSKRISQHITLPESVQPVFAHIYSRDELSVKSWFSGNEIDYSFICGLSIVASVLNGFTDREAVVHCHKKKGYVQWIETTNEVLYTGSAIYIFSGSFYLNEDKEIQE